MTPSSSEGSAWTWDCSRGVGRGMRQTPAPPSMLLVLQMLVLQLLLLSGLGLLPASAAAMQVPSQAAGIPSQRATAALPPQLQLLPNLQEQSCAVSIDYQISVFRVRVVGVSSLRTCTISIGYQISVFRVLALGIGRYMPFTVSIHHQIQFLSMGFQG